MTIRERMARVPVPVAIFVFVIVTLGPLVSTYTAQPASRYTLTAAIAEHGTVDLQRYKSVLGVDHAIYRGRLRSDKAIGQPLLDVPVYAVGRAVGAESATHLRNRGDLGMWWSTFWTSLVPFALLLVLMYRVARGFAPKYALTATFALGFATMMLPHAVNLYGHVLAALFGFAAFVASERESPSTRRLLAVGFLASAAVAVEYHAAIIAVVVFAAVAIRVRWRSLWVVVGALGPALVVAIYQWRAFGAWWHTPFNYYAGELDGTTRGGYSFPTVQNLNAVFVGTRGLLLISPVVLVALAGAVWLARSGTGVARRHAVVACVISAAYLALCAGWSGTRFLEEPGPRYAIPALPFLVVPLTMVWKRWRTVARVATIVGAVFMVAAAFTFILVQVGNTPLMYLRYVRNGSFASTVWSMAFGRFGVVLYGVTVALAALTLSESARHSQSKPRALEPAEIRA